MGKTLIKDIMLDSGRADILIDGNIISKIAAGIASEPDYHIIDGKGMRALPGFVNMHTHTAMNLLKGVSEDTRLQEWLQIIWRIEPQLNEEMLYWGAKLAFLEMIKSGTTSFLDMYWMIPVVQRAADEMGLRGNYSYVHLDNGDAAKAEHDIEECISQYEASKGWNSQHRFHIAIHGDYTVGEKTMLWARDFAAQHGLKIHIHASETAREVQEDIAKRGLSPIEYLDSLGLLSDNTIVAHALWLSEKDIEILGGRHVNVVHNINSNLKISSGYKFLYNELRDAGANVCLGTDGAATNNNLDMLESAKNAAMMQKAWREDPAAMPLGELMNIITVNGAKALGLNCGAIREGALADIILVDTDSASFIPDYNFYSNLIYAANSTCIDTAICDGKVIMRGRKVEGEEEILQNGRRIAQELKKLI